MLKTVAIAMLTLSLAGCATTEAASVKSNSAKAEMPITTHMNRKVGGCSTTQAMPPSHAMGVPSAAVLPNIYAEAMTKMHTAMPMAGSGNADEDFMRGMIPHHQGAVDMANIALEKSSDPVIRKLATDIITTQKAEMAIMQRWLAER